MQICALGMCLKMDEMKVETTNPKLLSTVNHVCSLIHGCVIRRKELRLSPVLFIVKPGVVGSTGQLTDQLARS